MFRSRRGLSLAAVSAFAVLAAAGAADAQTLAEAVAQAYQTNPIIQQQRALMRASDENYVQARAQLRPQADFSAQGNYTRRSFDQEVRGNPFAPAVGTGDYDDDSYSLGLNVVQPLYTGGRATADIRATQADILANREQIRNVEQQIVLNTVNFYVDIIRDRAILGIRENNVGVLRRQLLETRARFEVGEITRTDVAQTEARLANAEAAYAISVAQLNISRSNYAEIVGEAPGDLAPEPPLPGLPSSVAEAFAVAEAENPVIRVAQFQEQAANARVAVARSAYRPTVTLSGNATNTGAFTRTIEDTPVAASLTLRGTIPLFTGGLNDSRVRQAIENENAARINVETRRREVDQGLQQAWYQLLSARAQLVANQEGVRAAALALTGVQEEQRVGLRTTLDVLNAEQELRNAELLLVQARRDAYVAGAGVLQQMGRLQARDLISGFTEYDTRANFETVQRSGAVPWEGAIQLLDRIGAPVTTTPRRPPVPNPLPPETVQVITENIATIYDPNSSGPIPTVPNIAAAQPFRSSADQDAPARAPVTSEVSPGPLYREPVGGMPTPPPDPNRRPGVIPQQSVETPLPSEAARRAREIGVSPTVLRPPSVTSNQPIPNPGGGR